MPNKSVRHIIVSDGVINLINVKAFALVLASMCAQSRRIKPFFLVCFEPIHHFWCGLCIDPTRISSVFVASSDQNVRECATDDCREMFALSCAESHKSISFPFEPIENKSENQITANAASLHKRT